MEGSRLFRYWWGGKELFGIGRKIIAAIGTIETFWKDNYIGARGSC